MTTMYVHAGGQHGITLVESALRVKERGVQQKPPLSVSDEDFYSVFSDVVEQQNSEKVVDEFSLAQSFTIELIKRFFSELMNTNKDTLSKFSNSRKASMLLQSYNFSILSLMKESQAYKLELQKIKKVFLGKEGVEKLFDRYLLSHMQGFSNALPKSALKELFPIGVEFLGGFQSSLQVTDEHLNILKNSS